MAFYLVEKTLYDNNGKEIAKIEDLDPYTQHATLRSRLENAGLLKEDDELIALI